MKMKATELRDGYFVCAECEEYSYLEAGEKRKCRTCAGMDLKQLPPLEVTGVSIERIEASDDGFLD
jgi:hypothetical protein